MVWLGTKGLISRREVLVQVVATTTLEESDLNENWEVAVHVPPPASYSKNLQALLTTRKRRSKRRSKWA